MTALSTFSPVFSSACLTSSLSIMRESSSAVYVLPFSSAQAAWVPMLTLKTEAMHPPPPLCMSLASSPMRTEPSSMKQMTDGVRSFSYLLRMMSVLEVLALYLATAEYVVPRSIPTLICASQSGVLFLIKNR